MSSATRTHTDVDGFAYASRLTNEACYAIFDLAIFKLTVGETGALVEHPDLPALLERHHIDLDEE